MKRLILLTAIVCCFCGFIQPKGIVGSWISLDKVHKTHFFIKADGTVEKLSANGDEDIWSKTPREGAYIFKNNRILMITWSDKTKQQIEVKFIDGNAEFIYPDQPSGKNKAHVFLRIVDSEVIEATE